LSDDLRQNFFIESYRAARKVGVYFMWAERVMEGGGGAGVGRGAVGGTLNHGKVFCSLVWAISKMLALYEATRQSDWESPPPLVPFSN
jgi:hypothetical protein